MVVVASPKRDLAEAKGRETAKGVVATFADVTDRDAVLGADVLHLRDDCG